MTSQDSEVVDIGTRPEKRPALNNNGDGNGRDLRDRLIRLEERLVSIKENMATQSDVKDIKIWALSGALGGMVLAHGWRLRFSSCAPEKSSCAAVKVAPNLSVATILLNSPNSLAGKPCPHCGQTEEPFPFLLYSKYHSARRSMAEKASLAAAWRKPVDCRIPRTRIET